MKTKIKILFILILFFSLYHLGRDIFQILNIDTGITNALHRSHTWCYPACDYITFPLELLGIFGSLYVLKRNAVGKLGFVIIMTLPMWLIGTLLP